MKKTRVCLFVLLSFVLLVGESAFSRTRQRDQQWTTNLPLGMTHLLPGVSILPGGAFAIGSTFAYGLFGFAQVSSNVLLDAQGIYNVSAKVPVYDDGDVGITLHGGYSSQDVKLLVQDPTTGVTQEVLQRSTAFSPGLTFSYRMLPFLVGHIGVMSVVRNPDFNKSTLTKKSGYLHGTEYFAELAVPMTDYIALAVGGSYDATYSTSGLGATLHTPVLSVGAHFYFNVDQDAVLPILGVGISF